MASVAPPVVRREAGLNVLLVTVDTLRFDALGAYGQPRATSPLIDRLARAGVRFETAHAHNTVTLPSHANLLSGRYPFEHGVRDNAGFRFPRELATLATLLQAARLRARAPSSAPSRSTRASASTAASTSTRTRSATPPRPGRFQLPERCRDARRCAWRASGSRASAAPGSPGSTSTTRTRRTGRPRAVRLGVPRTPRTWARWRRPTTLCGRSSSRCSTAGRDGRTIVVADRRPRRVARRARRGDARPVRVRGDAARAARPLRARGSSGPGRTRARPPRRRAADGPRRDRRRRPSEGCRAAACWRSRPAGEDAPGPSYFEALAGMLGRGWAPLYGVVRDGQQVRRPAAAGALRPRRATRTSRTTSSRARPLEREAPRRDARRPSARGDGGPAPRRRGRGDPRAARGARLRERDARHRPASATRRGRRPQAARPPRPADAGDDRPAPRRGPGRCARDGARGRAPAARHDGRAAAGGAARAEGRAGWRPRSTRSSGRSAVEPGRRVGGRPARLVPRRGRPRRRRGGPARAVRRAAGPAARRAHGARDGTRAARSLARGDRRRSSVRARRDPGNPATLVQLATVQLAAGQQRRRPAPCSSRPCA